METAHHHLRFYQAQYQPSFSIDSAAADQAKVDDYLALGTDALNTPNIDPDFFNEGNLFSGSSSGSEKLNPLKSSKVDPLLGSGSTGEDSTYSLGGSSTSSLIGNFGMAGLNDLSLIQSHQMNQTNGSLQTISSSYSPQQQQQQLEISSQIININSPEMMLSSSSSSSTTSSSSPNNNSSNSSKPYSSNSLEQQLTGSYLGNIEDDPAFYSQVAEYEQLAFYGSPDAASCNSSNGYQQHQSLTSAPNSRSSSISSGSGCEAALNHTGYEYLLADCMTSSSELLLNSTTSTSTANSNTANSTSVNRLAPSPAASHYSSDSASSKTFTNLDAVHHQQMMHTQNGQLLSIKQEPLDQTTLEAIYQPTVIEEFESSQQQLYSAQPQLTDSTSYSTLNTADLAYYLPQQSQQQYSSSSQQMPSTVSSVLLQPQLQQQQQLRAPSTSGQGGRKRNSAAAFSSAASSASSSSSTSSSATRATPAAGTSTSTSASTSSSSKKPRMTKREKQKMMESDIGKFETENRDLRQSIDLLERQIAFCKRFLSENVAPVIQRQQQNSSTTSASGGMQGGGLSYSPMMIAVSEM